MNLIQYFVQTKDKCILTDSLFYGTIKYSESSGELKCENAFFVLLVTSGKAKIHIENAHDYTHGVGKNDLLIIPASMTARFRQLSEDYAMHCLVLTPPHYCPVKAGKSVFEIVET